MPAPSQGPYDNFGSDGSFPAGTDPWNGQPNTVTPSTGFITRGFMAGEKLVLEYLNFFLRNLYLWVEWLRSESLLKVTGPGSSNDKRLVRWNGVTGLVIQNGLVAESDTGSLSGVENLTLSGDILYTTPKTRTLLFHLYGGQGQGTWDVDSGRLTAKSNGVAYILPLPLPDGVTITQLRTKVNPGAARSGSNRTQLRLVGFSPALGSTSDPVQIVEGSAALDDTTTNIQTLTVGSLTSLVANDSKMYAAVLTSGSDAATNNDTFFAVEVTFSEPGVK